jgi:hypothetical protein
MSAPQNTLTIEYLDAQGQVQRTDQLSGAHFTLRVHSDALDVQATASSPISADSESLSAPPPQTRWQRLSPWLRALIFFGIFALLTALDLWIEFNPDDSSKNLVTFALGLMGGIAVWAALWALLGKIFAKHARYWEHVSIVLGMGIVLSVIKAAMHFLSFSLSWRVLGKMDMLIPLVGLCVLAWAHLRLIVPPKRLLNLRMGMLVFTLACVALMMWSNHRRQGTVLDRLHSPHLYRPSLQLSGASSSEDFFKQAQSMEATLKSRAAETEPGDDMTGSGEE